MQQSPNELFIVCLNIILKKMDFSDFLITPLFSNHITKENEKLRLYIKFRLEPNGEYINLDFIDVSNINTLESHYKTLHNIKLTLKKLIYNQLIKPNPNKALLDYIQPKWHTYNKYKALINLYSLNKESIF